MNSETIKALRLTALIDGSQIMAADEEGYVNTDVLTKFSQMQDSAVLSSPMFIDRKDHYADSALAIDSDSFLFGLKKLTGMLHKKRNTVFAQLTYVGDSSDYKNDLRDIVCVSASTASIQEAREISENEAESLPQKFASAAVRAQKSGFDGIVLSAAENNLFVRFLSPAYNQRTDGFGGSFENRAKLLCETTKALRKAVGKEFPILVKLDTFSFCDSEVCRFISLLKKAGCDALLLCDAAIDCPQLTDSKFSLQDSGLDNEILMIL